MRNVRQGMSLKFEQNVQHSNLHVPIDLDVELSTPGVTNMVPARTTWANRGPVQKIASNLVSSHG